MNKLFFTVGVILGIAHAVNAQEFRFVQIQGIVLEEDSGNPIDYAVCYLKANDHIGDVTDSQGRFTIKFPEQFLTDSIAIYLLGYEKLELPLMSLDLSEDTLVFKLERKSFLLDDIIVKAEGIDLRQMMIKALQEIPKNYPNKKHQLTGLYRKVSTEDKLYTHLEEGMITVDDYSYERLPEDIRIRVDAFRQTQDLGNVDSIFTKLSSKLSSGFREQYGFKANKIIRTYTNNYLRIHEKDYTHFNYKSLKKFVEETRIIELMDIIITENDTIYKLAYTHGMDPIPPSGLTYWMINKSDFAIVEFQIPSGFSADKLMDQVLVKFKKTGDRYYPYFIRCIQPRFINRDPDDNEYDIETIWIDEVKTDDFKKIKLQEMLDPMDTEKYKDVPYDSVTWHQLNLLQKYPLEKHIKSSLERNGRLEDQFQNKE